MIKTTTVLQQTNRCLFGTRISRSTTKKGRTTFTATPFSEDDHLPCAAKVPEMNEMEKRHAATKTATMVSKVPEMNESLRRKLRHMAKGTLHIYLGSSKHQYGPICKAKFPGRELVVLNTADMVESAFVGQQYATNDRVCPYFQEGVFENKSFGFAALSNTGEKQKAILKTYSHSILLTGEPSLHKQLDKMVQSLSRDTEINVTDKLKEFLTDYFSTLLIGEALPEDDPDRNALWELVDLLYQMFEPSMDIPLRMFPFLRHLPTRHGRLYKATIEARDRVAKRFFESQKSTFVEGRAQGLVDVCLQMQADDIRKTGSTWLTDDYIRGLMYDTALAGMTEMMKSLRMLILLMCHHQDVQSRVYAEINDVIGSDKTPTSEHREQMPFTQAVIMEMLRYVSQTPLALPHKCNKDVVLDGYLIEKNSGIVPNLWGIHHDEEVWGDPWVFRPDRFLDGGSNLIPSDDKQMKSFLPFSIGKRRCPGENFAMSRIFLIFVTLVQKLRFLAPEGAELPSVDPREYTKEYPLTLPVYTCKVLQRN